MFFVKDHWTPSAKADTGHRQTKGHGCVPIILYLKKKKKELARFGREPYLVPDLVELSR